MRAKTLQIIYYTLTVFITFVFINYLLIAPSCAESSNNSDDGNAEDVLEEIENDRRQKIFEAIELQIPEETDNPNYTITFKPLVGETIQLSIDGEEFKDIKSPYALPSLSIGEHVLQFKIENQDGVIQTVDTEIIIVPRELRFSNDLQLLYNKGDVVNLYGSALPDSQVMLWIISSDEIIYKNANVDQDGGWNVELQELDCGDYKIGGLVRKNGLTSTKINWITITYCGDGEQSSQSVVDGSNQEAESNFWIDTYDKMIDFWRQDNSTLYMYLIVATLTGLIIGLVYHFISINKWHRKVEKMIISTMRGDEAEMTLRYIDQQNTEKTSKDTASHRKASAKKNDGRVGDHLRKSNKDVQQTRKKKSRGKKHTFKVSNTGKSHKGKIKDRKSKTLSREEFIKKFKLLGEKSDKRSE